MGKFIPFLFGGLISLLVIFGFLIVRSNQFSVKKVDVSLDKVGCADTEAIKNSSGVLGQNLILLDSSKVIDNIRREFICVRDVILSKNIPDKVNLSVSGREALGKLMVSSEATGSSLENIATPSAQSKEGFLVDKDGVVFSISLEQINVPSIFINNAEISLDTKLEETVTNSLKILERVKIFNLNLNSAQILGNFLIIFPSLGNPKVIFRLDDDINTQLASLQLILGKAKIDEVNLEFIDLRFDKPIVKFAPNKK